MEKKKKEKKKKGKITAWGNLKDESAVSLLTSVKMRAMEGNFTHFRQTLKGHV